MQQVHRQVQPEGQFDEEALIYMLGEELKKPLTTIKALSESSENQAIVQESRRALRTIDNILYYQQIYRKQEQLQFTTVHAGNTLKQVEYALRPLSLERGCETEIHVQGGLAPIYADPAALKHGLESLWQAVLGMTSRPSSLNWHVYRLENSIRIMVVNSGLQLDKVVLTERAGRAGKSRQPFAGLAGPSTDLLAAQGIFSLLGGKLAKAQKQGEQGLAISLPISTQLAFV